VCYSDLEPDLRSAEEAALYISKIRTILMYLDTCDGNMQEGSLRADVNISVRRPKEDYGTRCEIKNLNSIKFIKQAIEYESRRQIQLIEKGGVIAQNTLLFNTQTGKNKPMRSKEDAHDYRYFPDPDLLPLVLENVFIEKIKNEIPELPDKRKERYINNLQLSNYDALVLTAEKEVGDYFDLVLETHKELKVSAKLVANWITSELFSILKKKNINITNNPISADFLGQLVLLIISDKISGKIAKDVFEEMFNDKKSPNEIIEKKGLIQVSDTKEIEAIINEILNKNKDKVSNYKSGKTKLLGFFVGQAMKLSKGKANPKILNDILLKKLL
jgi:aspartyl-tRNA(Asn)/glutamyl-tRNA(Gln) amidotransferase subunit B